MAFTASQTLVYGATPVTLSWTTSDASSLQISGAGDVTNKIETTITVSATTTYTLTASNSLGTVTAEVTVNESPACQEHIARGSPFPGDTNDAALGSQAVVDPDGAEILIPYLDGGHQAKIWNGSAWVSESIQDTGYISDNVTPMVPLAGKFYGFVRGELSNNEEGEGEISENSNDSFTYTDITSPLAGDLIENFQIAGVDTSTGTLALSMTDAYGNLGLVEGVPGGPLAFSYVATGFANIFQLQVIGLGYAKDGTAWILYIYGTQVSFAKRSGSVWSTTTIAISPTNINYGAASAFSPVTDKGLLLWATGNTAYSLLFDVDSPGVFDDYETLTTATGTMSFGAAFSPDGTEARYAIFTGTHLAFTGTMSNWTNHAPTSFHPELLVRSAQPFYDPCGTAEVIYQSATNAAPSSVTYTVEKLP